MLTFPLLRPRQNYTAKCLASFRLSLELQTFLDFMFIKTLSPSGEWRGQSPLQLTVRLASDLTKSVPSLESDGSTPSWSDPHPCMPEVFGLVPEGEKEKIDEEEGPGHRRLCTAGSNYGVIANSQYLSPLIRTKNLKLKCYENSGQILLTTGKEDHKMLIKHSRLEAWFLKNIIRWSQQQ